MKSMASWTSKRSIGVVLILAAMVIVTICGFTDHLLSVKATSSDLKQTFATFNHAPTAAADLVWSQTNHTLVVTVTASGLAPNSTHPGAIHNSSKGNCRTSTQGDVVYGLNPVTADSSGKGTAVTTVPNVQGGIPAQGWYIDLHNGPQLADKRQQERIACANITNPNALMSTPPPTNPMPPSTNKAMTHEHPPSTTHGTLEGSPPPPSSSSAPPSNSAPPPSSSSAPPPSSSSAPPSSAPPPTNAQLVHVVLGGSVDNNQSVTVGGVKLSITRSNSSLRVRIFLFRLAANSTHMAHIHSGSCEDQGPIVHELTSVRADRVGLGTSTTTLSDVSSIPSTGWYVNVHRASTTDGLNSQEGFDPIACANVSPSRQSGK